MVMTEYLFEVFMNPAIVMAGLTMNVFHCKSGQGRYIKK